MRRDVKEVISYIRSVAHMNDLRGDKYLEFLEMIEYELEREIEEGDFSEEYENE